MEIGKDKRDAEASLHLCMKEIEEKRKKIVQLLRPSVRRIRVSRVEASEEGNGESAQVEAPEAGNALQAAEEGNAEVQAAEVGNIDVQAAEVGNAEVQAPEVRRGRFQQLTVGLSVVLD